MTFLSQPIRLQPDYGECHGPAEETPRWCSAVPRGDYSSDQDKPSGLDKEEGKPQEASDRAISSLRPHAEAFCSLESLARNTEQREKFIPHQQYKKDAMFPRNLKRHQEELHDLIEELRAVTNEGPEYVQVTQALPSHIWEDPYAAWWNDQAEAFKKDIRRMIDQHNQRAALEKPLIHLGDQHPELRNHIRPVLDSLMSAPSRQASNHSRRKASLRSIDMRDLKAEIIMTAENDGEAYRRGKDARMAVENALPGFVERFKKILEDLKPDVIQEVHDGWHGEE